MSRRKRSPGRLTAGAAEVDITPPVGTGMVGGLQPRPSTGVDDPLFAKALVVEANGVHVACVQLDIALLPRSLGDPCVRLASERTGIPADHIIWTTSHTHTGPITEAEAYPDDDTSREMKWTALLPGKFAEAVMKADAARQPVSVSRVRGYCDSVMANRRFRYKDGREINRWLQNRGEDDVQCLGSAAPIDPEVAALCFDNKHGRPVVILWTFACHANAGFGAGLSADYPAIVAARFRKQFGKDVTSLYLPGACGDVNPLLPYREIGSRLADVLIGQLETRKPMKGPVVLDACRKDVVVPFRKFRSDDAKRQRESQWDPVCQKWFTRQLAQLRKKGKTSANSFVQAFRIGDTGFVTLPGELFVQWGLHLKEKSPFPWTFPVELSGDYLGYLVTEQAYRAGGYESLYSWAARPSVKGVRHLVTSGLACLKKLWR